MKVAVLDDYHSVAANMADWASLPDGIDVTFFSDHLSDENALAQRLADFDIVMGMRERTAFPRSLLQRLPALRCLITTGARNASFDVDAATELGITVCGTPGAGEGPTELTWGLILGILYNLTVFYVGSKLGDLVPFLVLLAILMIRPQGLFGLPDRNA